MVIAASHVSKWYGQVSGLNDVTLLHEQALLDMAAGHVFLRERGFEAVVSVGHSGGAALVSFYQAQAEKLTLTHLAHGARLSLSEADLVFFIGSHAGGQVTNGWQIPQLGTPAAPESVCHESTTS